MINQDQSIPCPVCQTKIPFDTEQLIMGVQYSCPNCQAVIGIVPEPKLNVEKIMDEFESLMGDLKSKRKKIK